jgi:hypothetical protein
MDHQVILDLGEIPPNLRMGRLSRLMKGIDRNHLNSVGDPAQLFVYIAGTRFAGE